MVFWSLAPVFFALIFIDLSLALFLSLQVVRVREQRSEERGASAFPGQRSTDAH